MAFEKFKGFFSKAEDVKLPEDVLSTLSAEHRNTLNVLRDALQRNSNLTGEQIGALSFVKDALRDTVGEQVMEEAIANYFKEEPESRLAELSEIVSRQEYLQATLMKSMADVDRLRSPEALAALERAKNSLRVLSAETFSTADVEAVCAEVKASDAYTQFINERVLAETAVANTDAAERYTTGVAPSLPQREPHTPAGTPNTEWKPYTKDDTLHGAPPPILR